MTERQPDKRRRLLDDQDIDDLYGLPRFDAAARGVYFALTPSAVATTVSKNRFKRGVTATH